MSWNTREIAAGHVLSALEFAASPCNSIISAMAASTSMAVTRSAGLGLWSSAVCRCSRPAPAAVRQSSPSASPEGKSQRRRSFATQAQRPSTQDDAAAAKSMGGPSRPRARLPEVRSWAHCDSHDWVLGCRLPCNEHHGEKESARTADVFV